MEVEHDPGESRSACAHGFKACSGVGIVQAKALTGQYSEPLPDGLNIAAGILHEGEPA